MVGFGGQLTDKEMWSIIQYLRSVSGEHGSGMMGRGGGKGGMVGWAGGSWQVVKMKVALI